MHFCADRLCIGWVTLYYMSQFFQEQRPLGHLLTVMAETQMGRPYCLGTFMSSGHVTSVNIPLAESSYKAKSNTNGMASVPCSQ